MKKFLYLILSGVVSFSAFAVGISGLPSKANFKELYENGNRVLTDADLPTIQDDYQTIHRIAMTEDVLSITDPSATVAIKLLNYKSDDGVKVPSGGYGGMTLTGSPGKSLIFHLDKDGAQANGTTDYIGLQHEQDGTRRVWLYRELQVQRQSYFSQTARFNGAADFYGATTYNSTVDFTNATVTGLTQNYIVTCRYYYNTDNEFCNNNDFTITKTAVGDYSVSHAIGHTNYACTATALGSAESIGIYNYNTTSFDVKAFDHVGAAYIDAHFNLMCHVW